MNDSGENNFDQIRRIIEIYFSGLYNGDVALLRSVFHPTAMLQAPGLRLSRDEWLSRVSSRAVPREEGGDDGFQVLAVDVVVDLAMVKAFCPLFGHQYIDFLTLLKEERRWLIINKTYADTAASAA